MAILFNTGDWFTLGHGNHFRKVELYQVDWPGVDLRQMFVAAAPYGGPIAVVRDWKQFVKVATSGKPVLKIFTCSGNLLSTINWNSGNFLTMGWTDTEELLCVQDDGLVLSYDMFGKFQHTFSMGQEVNDSKVIDARIFQTLSGTGVAVMTTNHRIFFVNNSKDPKTKLLPEMPKSMLNPSTWTMLTEDRSVLCLVVREKEIFRICHGDSIVTPQSIQIQAEYNRIEKIAISFNHMHVALCTDTGHLWLGSSDLKMNYCEFDTGHNEVPNKIEWCLDSNGDGHAVVLSFSTVLLIVGMNGESNIYTYDSSIHLVPEIDCVRVLSNSYHEMIQRVPKCVNNIFGINISEPSSYLLMAQQKFQKKSHESNEYLCFIGDKLDVAVQECIEAAGYEWDPETQKSLFRAAYFGKGFIPNHNPDFYVKMSRIIRVLNNIRHDTIGIPLTLKQFSHINAKVLLDRLVARKHYGLAIQIAKHLKLPEYRILEHWAFHQVMQSKADDIEVARRISDKFGQSSVQGVSFCTIARKAHEVGKTKLAIMLLELEPRQNLRVPLLLKLGEHKKALHAATQSGDTDLVYTVLLQLKETTQLADFQMTIRTFPLAQNLYKKYCSIHSPSALKDIYTQEDDFLSQAEMTIREGMQSLQIDLPVTANNYKKAHKDIEAELCDETRKLQKIQKDLEKRDRRFIGLSLHDTIRQILLLGDIKQADKLKSDFKVPDRRYWWLRLQVLAENDKWDEIEKFSKTKKSPIGYEPFVEIALNHNNLTEAKKYLPRCRDETKVKWHIRAGLYREAAFYAYEQKDMQSLLTIHRDVTRLQQTEIIGTVEDLMKNLTERK
uniref:Vacuolar protein sorting-associated protein 16 homolog n=1 Tax=Culicoides sonorensis TaxID=179676 RepID=A0A336MYR0_CULSO